MNPIIYEVVLLSNVFVLLIENSYALAHIANMNVKKNIKYLMEKAGMNPTSLAAALKNAMPKDKWVPQATIFRIIEGESENPRTSSLAPIAEYFGVDLRILMFGDLSTDEIHEVKKAKSAIHKEILEVIKLMDGTDNRGREKILSAAKDAIELHQAHLRMTNQDMRNQINEIDLISLANEEQMNYGDSLSPLEVRR